MSNLFNVLVRPLVTEKSNYQSSKLQQYAFVVSNEATRTMVKDAVETIYDVKVVRVNVVNAPAKRGRRARSQGQRGHHAQGEPAKKVSETGSNARPRWDVPKAGQIVLPVETLADGSSS